MQQFTQTIVDDSGNPCGNLSVPIYYGGTTISATIYSDNGSTTKSNPATLTDQGVLTFYAPNGKYDIVAAGTRKTSQTISIVLNDPADPGKVSSIKATAGMTQWGTALTTAQLSAITTASLPTLTTSNVSGLTTTQVAALNTVLGNANTIALALKALGASA